jgi:hypothetical protein
LLPISFVRHSYHPRFLMTPLVNEPWESAV